MNFSEAQIAIQAHMASNWTATPIHYQNNSFKPVPEYIKCHVLFGDSKQISLGLSPLTRHPGVLVFIVLVKLGEGSKRGLDLASSLSDIFDKQKISGIQFETPKVAILGEIESYYQINVQCPFYYDTQS